MAGFQSFPTGTPPLASENGSVDLTILLFKGRQWMCPPDGAKHLERIALLSPILTPMPAKLPLLAFRLPLVKTRTSGAS